jgi:hypothetical protein
MDISGTGLDSFLTRPTDSHLLALVQKSARHLTHNSKPHIVVTVFRIVVVTNSRTAVPRIIVPRPAPLYFACPMLIIAKLAERRSSWVSGVEPNDKRSLAPKSR